MSISKAKRCKGNQKNEERKGEMKKNPKKKWVEMKMKRNKEGRPKQNWSLT